MHKLLALLLILCAGPVMAESDFAFEVTPFAGYRMGGQVEAEDENLDIRLEDSASYGLIFTGRYNNETEWEVLYSNQQTTSRISDSLTGEESIFDFESHILQLGGTYLFAGEKVIPYMAFTLGGTHIRTRSLQDESDTFLSGSFGLGLKFLPHSRVGLRLEARAYGTLINSSTEIFCSTGPDANVCAIRLKGDLVGQIETFAGISIRF